MSPMIEGLACAAWIERHGYDNPDVEEQAEANHDSDQKENPHKSKLSGWRNELHVDTSDPISYPDDVERPKTRADCVNGERPCPFVSCRHNLMLEVSKCGKIYQDYHDDIYDMVETCALDAADRGGATQTEVAAAMRVSAERIRQIETDALKKLLRKARSMGIDLKGLL
jgi:hypothetical protein